MTLYVGTYEEWNQRIVGEIAELAARFGADGFFSIGPGAVSRRNIETYSFLNLADALEELPGSWIAMETGGVHLGDFTHPEDAVYLLGPNTSYLTKEVLGWMQHTVTVEGGTLSTPAVAAVTLHDRLVSLKGAALR